MTTALMYVFPIKQAKTAGCGLLPFYIYSAVYSAVVSVYIRNDSVVAYFYIPSGRISTAKPQTALKIYKI